MGVRDRQLHPDQAAGDQAAQKLAPEGLGLGLADVEPDHLAAAAVMHTIGDHQALAPHPAAVPDLLHLRVEPQIRVAALQRPLPERLDLLVEALGDARHLRARDPQSQRLHQLVDLPGRDPGHVGLLDHVQQRPLGTAARLEETREVAAPAQLRDLQLDLARARVPAPWPIPVAMRGAIRCALTELGPDQLRDLHLHQLLDHPAKRLAHKVDVLVAHQLGDDLLDRHPLPLGHRGDSSRRTFSKSDDHEHRGGRTYLDPSAAVLHHAMGRDRFRRQKVAICSAFAYRFDAAAPGR